MDPQLYDYSSSSEDGDYNDQIKTQEQKEVLDLNNQFPYDAESDESEYDDDFDNEEKKQPERKYQHFDDYHDDDDEDCLDQFVYNHDQKQTQMYTNYKKK